ncbi:hypothetical protein Tco_0425840 [Tanacetum coccineum]
MMMGTKFDIEKFDGKNDFALWQDTMKLEDVVATLNSRELQKMTEAKGDGGEGLYVRRRSGQRDMEQGKDSAWSKSQVRSSRLRCYIIKKNVSLRAFEAGSPVIIKEISRFWNGSWYEGQERGLRQHGWVKFHVGQHQEDHTFEVEPHGNVDHVVRFTRSTNSDLILSFITDRGAALSMGNYFNVKIRTVIRLFLQLLSGKSSDDIGCLITGVYTEAEIWATKVLLDKGKGNTLGMKIIRIRVEYQIGSGLDQTYASQMWVVGWV